MPSPNASTKRPRTIAIGDIHGCIHAFEAVLDAIRPRAEDRLVVLGDFIDQGHDSAQVINRLITLQDECQLIALMGNHEEMLLAALENQDALHYWINCGGFATLNSYYFGATLDVIPADHLSFIRGCRDNYVTESNIFVHANFDPALPMDQQPAHQSRWNILEPPVVCHQSGKTVIVGHTEQPTGEILDLGCVQCIDTSCWRHGWLTALSVDDGQVWQASRFGAMREINEPPVGQIRVRS